MKRKMLATALTVLLLSGCAGQGTPLAEPTLTASPTPTATPTPTPTPDVALPADPEDWVIGFGSIGPITLGQPLTPQLPALSAFEVTSVADCPLVMAEGPYTLWMITFPGDTVSTIVTGDGSLPENAPVQVKTAEGISVNSTEAEVLAAYPGVEGREGLYSTTIYSLTDGTTFINIVVNESDGLVGRIHLSDADSVPGEFC